MNQGSIPSQECAPSWHTGPWRAARRACPAAAGGLAPRGIGRGSPCVWRVRRTAPGLTERRGVWGRRVRGGRGWPQNLGPPRRGAAGGVWARMENGFTPYDAASAAGRFWKTGWGWLGRKTATAEIGTSAGGAAGRVIQHPVNVRAASAAAVPAAGAQMRGHPLQAPAPAAAGNTIQPQLLPLSRQGPPGAEVIVSSCSAPQLGENRRAQLGLAGNTMRCRARTHLRRQRILRLSRPLSRSFCFSISRAAAGLGPTFAAAPLPIVSVSLSGLAQRFFFSEEDLLLLLRISSGNGSGARCGNRFSAARYKGSERQDSFWQLVQLCSSIGTLPYSRVSLPACMASSFTALSFPAGPSFAAFFLASNLALASAITDNCQVSSVSAYDFTC